MRQLGRRGIRPAMIVFPDTNFFLHFKDPTEIHWSEVTVDDHIRIFIYANTQVELDKKKFELRGRPKQRARKWTAAVGEMISNDALIVLREAGPRITLELYLDRPGLPPEKWSSPRYGFEPCGGCCHGTEEAYG